MSEGLKICTGFNDGYFHQWGASWLASLVEMAGQGENILVVSHNLSSVTKNKITGCGGKIIPALGKFDDIRADTLATIAFQAQNDGFYAYWDADVYFQEKLNSLAPQDKFLISENKNPGFIAAPGFLWPFLSQIQDFMALVSGKTQDVLAHLVRYHSNLVCEVSDEWNFTDLPALKEESGKLVSKKTIPRAIHPSGRLKSILNKRELLFHERFPDLWEKYSGSGRKSSRRLVKK